MNANGLFFLSFLQHGSMFTVQILETTQVLQKQKSRLVYSFTISRHQSISFDETEAEQTRPRGDGDQGRSPSSRNNTTYQ